ncbi:MAG TPA: DUF359 domain-containing protein [Euryarchaeota archaeon]|nr:DUF359 domain-containing protein [Euryarchaeota archaeon]
MSTGSLRFVSDDGRTSHDLSLPEELRERLSKPFGTVASEERLSEIIGSCTRVISVGDIVSWTLLSRGFEPQLMVFDRRTRRGPCDKMERLRRTEGALELKVKNPPGRLSASLWNAVTSALRSRRRTEIEVDGEEDLASLACIYQADKGDCVIYGIPDVGIDVVEVNEEMKDTVAGILQNMTIVR